ncbi:Bacterial Ig-like domain (group 2) [Chlamydia trachomatis]|nr:Bacterial Ig-like domain (group 2) [Chlamydia trachomatis]
MINPAYNHMGMGTFIGERRYFHTSAQAFSHKTCLNESATGQYGAFSQTIEVQSNRLSNIKIESKNSAIGSGAPETATLSGTVIVDGFQNGSVTAHFPAVHWSSSNGTIAQVDSNGMITGLNSGSVTITARSGGVSATKTFTVKAIQSI